MIDRNYHTYISFSITKQDTSTVKTSTAIANGLDHFDWRVRNDIVDILETVGYEVEDIHTKTFITEGKKYYIKGDDND